MLCAPENGPKTLLAYIDLLCQFLHRLDTLACELMLEREAAPFFFLIKMPPSECKKEGRHKKEQEAGDGGKGRVQ